MKALKKTLISLVILASVFSGKAFATGAGIQAGLNPGIFINHETKSLENFTGNITGSLRLSRIPAVIGAGFEGGKFFSDFNYGLSLFGDYWALEHQLKNTWSLYSGFGASAKFLTDDFKDWSLSAGARFFAGINTLFYDGYLELYAQQNIVPTYLKELTRKDSTAAFMLCLPFEAGLRMHF